MCANVRCDSWAFYVIHCVIPNFIKRGQIRSNVQCDLCRFCVIRIFIEALFNLSIHIEACQMFYNFRDHSIWLYAFPTGAEGLNSDWWMFPSRVRLSFVSDLESVSLVGIFCTVIGYGCLASGSGSPRFFGDPVCTHRTFSLLDPEVTTKHGLPVPFFMLYRGIRLGFSQRTWIMRCPHNLFLPVQRAKNA
jgi:hypothetical protein